MTTTPLYPIACPHGNSGACVPVLLDHHPLTKVEIKLLLDNALKVEGLERVRIGDRLRQAIPKMTCPEPFIGLEKDKTFHLDSVYSKRFTEGGSDNLVELIFNIINAKDTATLAVIVKPVVA